MVSCAKYKTIHAEEIKILTSKQKFLRLSIALASAKAGKLIQISEKLLK